MVYKTDAKEQLRRKRSSSTASSSSSVASLNPEVVTQR